MLDDPFDWVGATIEDKYRVESVVGQGGFAVVYRAEHLRLGEAVALKCLRLPATLREQERQDFQAKFVQEGRLLHRLSKGHAGIVQALDVGTAFSPNGTWTPYLVLEWLEGRSLQEEMERWRHCGDWPKSLSEAVAFLKPAAEALAEAHAQGVAHRDIKPSNLFLATIGDRQMLKILDFGIAKVITANESITAAYAATGLAAKAFTPQYGAPEQFNPRLGGTGPWTDVFALALLLVELCTGERALIGEDVIQLHVSAGDSRSRPTPRARGLSIPEAVDEVIAKALAVEPVDRFDHVEAFWQALEQALAEAGEAGAPADTSPEPRPRGAVAAVTSEQLDTAQFMQLVVSQGEPTKEDQPAEPAGGVAEPAGSADEPAGSADEPAMLPEPTQPSGAAAEARPAPPPATGRKPLSWLVVVLAIGAVMGLLLALTKHLGAPAPETAASGAPSSSAAPAAGTAAAAARSATAAPSSPATGTSSGTTAATASSSAPAPPAPVVADYASWPLNCMASTRPCGKLCCRSGRSCGGPCDEPLPPGQKWDLRLDSIYYEVAGKAGRMPNGIEVRLGLPDGQILPVGPERPATVTTADLLAGFEVTIVQVIVPTMTRLVKLPRQQRREVTRLKLCRGLQYHYQSPAEARYRDVWFYVDPHGEPPPERCQK